MKKIFLFVSLISSFSFSQTYSCRETCQHWETFEKFCMYATKCQVESNLVRYSYCDRFDSFKKACASELTQMVPFTINPYGPPLMCTERCQYFDSFNNQCFYKTTCEYAANILKYTECGKWDSFEHKCEFPIVTYYWNVY